MPAASSFPDSVPRDKVGVLAHNLAIAATAIATSTSELQTMMLKVAEPAHLITTSLTDKLGDAVEQSFAPAELPRSVVAEVKTNTASALSICNYIHLYSNVASKVDGFAPNIGIGGGMRDDSFDSVVALAIAHNLLKVKGGLQLVCNAEAFPTEEVVSKLTADFFAFVLGPGESLYTTKANDMMKVLAGGHAAEGASNSVPRPPM